MPRCLANSQAGPSANADTDRRHSDDDTTHMSSIPRSAFITVGESDATVARMRAGLAPYGEYPFLADAFESVRKMTDSRYTPGSFRSRLAFAYDAFNTTIDAENVHLGEEFPGIEYLAVHALRGRKKRLSMLVHNTSSRRRTIPLGTLGLSRKLYRALCLSEQSKRELIRDHGLTESQTSVVGSRVDTDFFRPDQHIPAQDQICSAGAINRDYDLLIRAVEPLGIPLKIAADTAWRYSAGTEEKRVAPPFVEMRSWGNYVNLRSLYAESPIVVVPLARSLMSGVTVILEAMAMGRAVIVTDNDYVRDYVTHGETGLLVPPGDVEGMRKQIAFLRTHPDEAGRIGARAREWVCSKFTVRHYVERILSVW